ncbi:MAG: hypothetical protein KJ645_12495 [Planctomycetes bacterium]|nr:hypothetical protein [Planctomycetota bacterium]
MQTFYQGIVRFSERFGHMLSRLLLTILYFVFVTPAGIFITLFCDPLRIKRSANSNWQKVDPARGDKKKARSQI